MPVCRPAVAIHMCSEGISVCGHHVLLWPSWRFCVVPFLIGQRFRRVALALEPGMVKGSVDVCLMCSCLPQGSLPPICKAGLCMEVSACSIIPCILHGSTQSCIGRKKSGSQVRQRKNICGSVATNLSPIGANQDCQERRRSRASE